MTLRLKISAAIVLLSAAGFYTVPAGSTYAPFTGVVSEAGQIAAGTWAVDSLLSECSDDATEGGESKPLLEGCEGAAEVKAE